MNAKVNISNRAGASFPVRRMNFDFDQVPEYWMNGSAGLTHFMTALSALFPDGEKLFIDSVRAVRYHPAIKDNEALQKEISAFIGQEAMHTQEHVGFNASAQKYGHDVSSLERITGRYIQFARKNFAKAVKPFGMTQEMVDLTATTALEHFTATIASELLRNLHIQELMTDDTIRILLQKIRQLFRNHRIYSTTCLTVSEFLFGLSFKLWLFNFDTDNCCQSFTDIISGKCRIAVF